jgi:Cys-tRNA(Pro)/Cys-tRNA(Cys) deacylase
MIVCSIASRVNFQAVGGQLGCQKAEVARPAELQDRVGYPLRGVSPIGLDGIPVLIDEELFQLPTILVGAGEEGVEIEIVPADLERVTQGRRVLIRR